MDAKILKIFSEYTAASNPEQIPLPSNELSLKDLISLEDIESKVFEIIQSHSNSVTQVTIEDRKFVQVKLSSYNYGSDKKELLQFIDISSSILYDKQKDHSEFLGLVNACVSHELRNPLNSIVA